MLLAVGHMIASAVLFANAEGLWVVIKSLFSEYVDNSDTMNELLAYMLLSSCVLLVKSHIQ